VSLDFTLPELPLAMVGRLGSRLPPANCRRAMRRLTTLTCGNARRCEITTPPFWVSFDTVAMFGPTVLSFMILVKSYDCEKQLTHEESVEWHKIDGSVQTFDVSKNPKWYPAPENRAADPSFDFVCG
jgi:hypothetical protein